MAVGSAALKFGQLFLYFIAFCCSTIVLGLYSYFLAVQASNHVTIPQWQKAVEGISGIGVAYTILGFIFVCCLGQLTFFAFLGIVGNLLLTAGFIAVAILTRQGAKGCTGDVLDTPLGTGSPDRDAGREGRTFTANFHTACRLNQVSFAVSIIAAFVFFFSIFTQFWIARHHQKQKRYGPSPANNYTSGNGIKFWRRRRGAKSAHAAVAKDAEGGYAHNGVTGTGAVAPGAAPLNATNGHGHHGVNGHQTTGTTGGYHTGPTGTAVNPYGYDNTRPGTNF